MTLSEAWVDGLAGWASGAMVVAVVQPIDTILTRAQASISLPTSIHDHPVRAPTAATATTTATTLSYYQLLRQLTHSFGVSSLWRGSAPMIYAVPLQNALLMGGYGMGKQWSSSHDRNDATNTNNHLLSVFIGGSVGGIAQSFLMSPVELIKVQQQIYVANRGGGWSSSSSSLVHHWQRGLTATLLRDGIPHGVWFASYEWSKTELTRQLLDMEDPQHPPYGIGSLTTMNQVGVPMMAGAVAATVAWVRVLLSLHLRLPHRRSQMHTTTNHSPIATNNRPLDILSILSRLGFKPPTYS